MGSDYPPGALARLDLSAEQRAKIAEIRREQAKKHWELMGRMHEALAPFDDGMQDPGDEKAARDVYRTMADAHREMFESAIDARKRIDAVLTVEQRESLRRDRGPGRAAR